MSLVLETSKYFFARSCWSFLLYSRTTCNVEVKSRIIAYCTDQFSSVKSCFLKWLISSRGRKTHNQHRDIVLCMFNFVNSSLNCFTWLYKGMPGVKCLESFGFLCSLTGYVACELVCLCISNTLMAERPSAPGWGCRHTVQCLKQKLWETGMMAAF